MEAAEDALSNLLSGQEEINKRMEVVENARANDVIKEAIDPWVQVEQVSLFEEHSLVQQRVQLEATARNFEGDAG